MQAVSKQIYNFGGIPQNCKLLASYLNGYENDALIDLIPNP